MSLQRSLHDAELKQSQLTLNRKESELQVCNQLQSPYHILHATLQNFRQVLEDTKAEHAAMAYSMSQNRVNLTNELAR